MELKGCLNKILSEWETEKKHEFTNNQLASFIRIDFAQTIERILDSTDTEYNVKASAGAGVWASVPWLSILNPQITLSTQDGIYPVYFFCGDGSGVYLSLNQGMTNPQKSLGTKEAKTRASKIITFLRSNIPELTNWEDGKLDLRSETGLCKSYEFPNIGSKFYSANDLPANDILVSDLKQLLSVYDRVVTFWPKIKDYHFFE